jgi:hypothetical protein
MFVQYGPAEHNERLLAAHVKFEDAFHYRARAGSTSIDRVSELLR